MSMNPRLTFQVRRSSPAPWGSNEWAWRSALATEARAVASLVQGWPIIGACFVVKLTFYLAPSTWERADLDNLAKPVLDTIFLSTNPQVRDRSLTGALFEVDDKRVIQLAVEKQLVSRPEEEGCDVSIECWPSAQVPKG